MLNSKFEQLLYVLNYFIQVTFMESTKDVLKRYGVGRERINSLKICTIAHNVKPLPDSTYVCIYTTMINLSLLYKLYLAT